jgi:hypothetical protein
LSTTSADIDQATIGERDGSLGHELNGAASAPAMSDDVGARTVELVSAGTSTQQRAE